MTVLWGFFLVFVSVGVGFDVEDLSQRAVDAMQCAPDAPRESQVVFGDGGVLSGDLQLFCCFSVTVQSRDEKCTKESGGGGSPARASMRTCSTLRRQCLRVRIRV